MTDRIAEIRERAKVTCDGSPWHAASLEWMRDDIPYLLAQLDAARAEIGRWHEIIQDEMACTMELINATGVVAKIEAGESTQAALLNWIKTARAMEAERDMHATRLPNFYREVFKSEFPGDNDALANGIHAMAELSQLRAEVERLRAVVDKLPKTADGVVVHEPMPLYWWDGNVLLVGAGSVDENLVFLDPNDRNVSFRPNCGIAGCYSTREAAEAAKEKP